MNGARQRTILLFTRSPRAEARAKRLPLDAGARLFEAFLSGWLERAAQASAELVVVGPAQSLPALRQLFPEACVAAQQGPTFGARLEAAFSFAFERSADSVLMVGGDSPPLALEDVEKSFAHLESHQRALALAPAEDGGVNAIGFNAGAERRLSNVRWLSADVDRQLRGAAAALGLALWLSPCSPDLDRARDLAGLYRLSRANIRWRAFRALLRLLLRPVRTIARSDDGRPRRAFPDSPATRGPPRSLVFSF